MIRKLRQKTARNEKGFTLIELMIVIAIIGILAAIAIPNFLAYRTKGQNSAAQAEAKNFYVCAVAYFADTSTTGTVVTADTSFFGHTGTGEEIPLYNNDPNVTSGGGTITDDLDGTITISPATGIVWSHNDSADSFTLDNIGNVF